MIQLVCESISCHVTIQTYIKLFKTSYVLVCRYVVLVCSTKLVNKCSNNSKMLCSQSHTSEHIEMCELSE